MDRAVRHDEGVAVRQLLLHDVFVEAVDLVVLAGVRLEPDETSVRQDHAVHQRQGDVGPRSDIPTIQGQHLSTIQTMGL